LGRRKGYKLARPKQISNVWMLNIYTAICQEKFLQGIVIGIVIGGLGKAG
jgi:hypothetical protein